MINWEQQFADEFILKMLGTNQEGDELHHKDAKDLADELDKQGNSLNDD
jgi:hypothetical protein